MNKYKDSTQTISILINGGRRMDANRVKQILASSADINVTYQGVSVWIDELIENENLATVHLRGPLEERSRVAIEDLIEES
jgi:small acid-soluble spore protein H (minor)